MNPSLLRCIMSPESTVDTGFEQLDGDLTVLFDLADSGRLESIAASVGDLSLKSEELAQLVPDSLLRIAFALSDSEEYAQLRSEVHEPARPVLETAKALVESKLKPLLSHPFAKERQRELMAMPEALTGLRTGLRTIRRIQSTKAWFGQPPPASASKYL